MKNKSCCFSGHRDIEVEKIPEIKQKLEEVLNKLIKEGYTDFYTGGAIGFDTVAAQCVLKIGENNPEIKLHVIHPCGNQTRGWSAENVAEFDRINSLAFESLYLNDEYFNGCMQVRNRYLVEQSSVIIAYLTRTSGGSAYTVKYAEKKGLKIINIAKSDC